MTFDASASLDSNGTIESYDWDFGDGSSGSGMNTTHTYGATGSYIITLTVTDNQGRTDSVSRAIKGSERNSAARSTSSGRVLIVWMGGSLCSLIANPVF